MGPTQPFTPPDKETKTTETTSRTGLGCTTMKRLIVRALATPIRKGPERIRPERICAYNGLPHSGRSFFGGTHRTHPGNRSCRRTPRFRSLPLGGKRLSDRGHNPQPPRCRPHMDTGRGRTNRSPGNAARSCRQLRPKARCSQEVELRRTILSHVFRSWSNAPTELQSPAWTTTRRGKVAQAVIFCRILPAFGGLCLKWNIDSEVHTHTQPHPRPMACKNASSAS